MSRRLLGWAALAATRLGHYTSTYCACGKHEQCRMTCKHCGRLCRCPICCHRQPPAPGGA